MMSTKSSGRQNFLRKRSRKFRADSSAFGQADESAGFSVDWPLRQGFMYLVAVMDWWSRYVLSWEVSNTLDAGFCIRAWEKALTAGRSVPRIHNTDQGSQFTSDGFIEAVESAGTRVSMDGKGRWMDNRFIERLWRSVKHEDVYLNGYRDGLELGRGLGRWFQNYNAVRPHQAIGYATPEAVYHDPGAYGARPMEG